MRSTKSFFGMKMIFLFWLVWNKNWDENWKSVMKTFYVVG